MDISAKARGAAWPGILVSIVTIAGAGAAFAGCDVLERSFDDPDHLTFSLSPTVKASLSRLAGNDLVHITENGELTFAGDFGEVDWNADPETGMPQGNL